MNNNNKKTPHVFYIRYINLFELQLCVWILALIQKLNLTWFNYTWTIQKLYIYFTKTIWKYLFLTVSRKSAMVVKIRP